MDADQPKAIRTRRRIFRWCGRGVALGFLGVVGTGVYLNQVGVPFFAKSWLLDRFRARGLSLAFERVRVRLGRGIVAENVAVESLKESGRERVSAGQLQIKLNWNSVFHLAPEIEAIHLRAGRLAIPIGPVDTLATPVELDHADAVVRLAKPDTWIVEKLNAEFYGIEISATGSITNVSQLWSRSKQTEDSSQRWKKPLGEVADTLRKFHFASAPKVTLSFHADPLSTTASDSRLTLSAARPVTPWGRTEAFQLEATLNPVRNRTNSIHASLSASLSRPETPWSRAQEVVFGARADFDPSQTFPDPVVWELHVRNPNTGYGRARTLDLSGRTVSAPGPATAAAPFRLPPANRTGLWHRDSAPQFQSQIELRAGGLHLTNIDCARFELAGELIHSTNAWQEGQFQIQLGKTKTPRLDLGGLVAAVRIAPEAAEAPVAPENAWWNQFEPFRIHVSGAATNLDIPSLHVDSAIVTAEYDTNHVSLDALRLRVLGGEVTASTEIEIPSRIAHIQAGSHLDIHALAPLLNDNGRTWLKQFSWSPTNPPELSGKVTGRLPAWTNTTPDWRTEILPTLAIDAAFSVTPGGYRGIPASSASGHIRLKDSVWLLPDLIVTRPEGRLDLSYSDDIPTQQYHFGFHSTIDPCDARSLLPTPKAREAFDAWVITYPPDIEGEIWGQWHHPELTGVAARIAVTNTSWRATHADRVSGTITYTNQVIRLHDGAVVDGNQHGKVDYLEYQVPTQWVILSNAVARLEPGRVTQLIGPKTHAMIEPFHFAEVPFVTLQGRFDKYGGNQNDVHFTVNAPGAFDWKLLHLTAPTGEIHYVGRSVLITNIVSGFYRGELRGNLVLDTGTSNSAPITAVLDARATRVDVHSLMTGLGKSTNRLEGLLSASAVLSSPDSQFPETWHGTGKANLRDGFLWDLPLVGIFTPILRTVTPDWGQARFTGGSASFIITNGQLRSTDLELKAASMKLDYSGSVDLKGQLDVTMRAEMFRKVPVLGPIAGLALAPFEKLFEYRLTGTIKQPKAEPAYIPSFLLAPFHPIQTIKSLLPSDNKTNDPPTPGQ